MNDTIPIDLPFVINRIAVRKVYDGVSDDLLSGGAGLKGLKDNSPEFTDPEKPSPEEIRRRTIRNNYRALLDISDAYYGKYYGPGIGALTGEHISGREFTALCHDGVTVVLQIPDNFNTVSPYLIAAPSSGSRGVYGAIGVVGEWALKNGYAVVYTDKGTGTGYHDFDSDAVFDVNGQAGHAGEIDGRSLFTTVCSGKERNPHRIGVKHSHSGQNTQKNWGTYVIQAINFGVYVLEMDFGRELTGDKLKKRLKIIAAGISNGGGASLMAAEKDDQGIIDAVVVSEPNITPLYDSSFSIVQGNTPPVFNHSKSIADYMTLLNIFQPCISLGTALKNAPLNFTAGSLSREQCETRTLVLKEKGLIKGESFEELAEYAIDIIRAAGIIKEQDRLQPSHYNLDLTRGIACTFISQYGRIKALDTFYGYSFAPVDEKGHPRAVTRSEFAAFFSDQTGIPPLGPLKLINDFDPNGPTEDRLSTSASSGKQDMNLDGALRLRRMVTGMDESGQPLVGTALVYHKRVLQGISETLVTTDTGKRPVSIVTGRSDAVLQINHTSRAYAGAKFNSGRHCDLFRYYEITNAHHIDSFNSLYADEQICKKPVHFAPLHCYYLQTLDNMVDYLNSDAPLPESQVVRPVDPQRIIPQIQQTPEKKDVIMFVDGILTIPD